MTGPIFLGGLVTVVKTSEYLTVGKNTWNVGPDIPGAGVYESCAVRVDDRIVIIGGVLQLLPRLLCTT